MLLRATKSLARTPPGCLHCIKQDFGVEKRVTATYVPLLFNQEELGSAPGQEIIFKPVLEGFTSRAIEVACLDDLGGRSKLTDTSVSSPLFDCPVVSVPMGHLSVSRKGFGEELRLSAVFSSKHEDCSERFVNPTSHLIGDYVVERESLVSGSVESLVAGPCGFGESLPVVKPVLEGFTSRAIEVVGAGSDPLYPVEIPESIICPLDPRIFKTGLCPASPGNSSLAGTLPSSLRMGSQLDTLGILNCECKGACDRILSGSDFQVDQGKCLSVGLKTVGMDHEVNKGLFADLGFTPNPDENHASIRSVDSDNDHGHASLSSFSKGTSKKWQPKPIKKISPVLMTLGEDILLNDIILTNALTLVGRFGRRNYIAESLRGWADKAWNDGLSSHPEIFILPRGWIAFKFSSVADADKILAGVWRWDKDGLLLKRWSPLFDPRKERYDQVPIWVKLPNLPFEFWSSDFFRLVGNTLGTHLEIDFTYLHSGVCCMGRVLVLLDFRLGLPVELVIKKGNNDFYQPLDYLGIPFRCYRCHGFGHLANECSLSFKKFSKVWRVKNGGNQYAAKAGTSVNENLDLHPVSFESDPLAKLNSLSISNSMDDIGNFPSLNISPTDPISVD